MKGDIGKMNRKIRLITAVLLLTASVSFISGCKSKTGIKGENTTGQIEQSSSNTGDKQQGDSTNTKNVSIEDWKFDVPEGFSVDNSDGPWYEKRYSNPNGVVLIFGYYSPNGVDKRTEKELFEAQRGNDKQDMISRYGSGEVTYEDVNNDNRYITTYFETRDLKVLKRSKIEGQVWKSIYIEIPISENEKDYEYILDIIK